MLTETDFVHLPDGINKPNIEIYMAGVFILDEMVIEGGIYKKEFYTLYHSSIITEIPWTESEEILLNFLKNKEESIEVLVGEKLGSIILSNPIFLEIPKDKPWVHFGTHYINGEFIKDV